MRILRSFASVAIATIMLAGCAGGGQSASPVQPGANLGGLPQLPTNSQSSSQHIFVAQETGREILEYAIDATGNAAPIATIAGSKTTLVVPSDVGFDTSGNLYVLDSFDMGPSVKVFAAGANGNVAPIRTITRAPTNFSGPVSIALDGSNNIYVLDQLENSIDVFAAGATGATVPSRVISGPSTGIGDARSLFVTSTGKIYVADFNLNGCVGVGAISVFASGANGNVAPLQTISGPHTTIFQPVALSVDSQGDIFAANRTGSFNPGEIAEFAPNATGDATPLNVIAGSNTTINITGSAGLALDASNNLYLTMIGTDAVTVFASGSSGNVAPSRIISGSNTGLAFPLSVRIH